MCQIKTLCTLPGFTMRQHVVVKHFPTSIACLAYNFQAQFSSPLAKNGRMVGKADSRIKYADVEYVTAEK